MPDRHFRRLVRPVMFTFAPMIDLLNRLDGSEAVELSELDVRGAREHVVHAILARGESRLLYMQKTGISAEQMWAIAVVLQACEKAGTERDPEEGGRGAPLPAAVRVRELQEKIERLTGNPFCLRSRSKVVSRDFLAIEGEGAGRAALLGPEFLDRRRARERERARRRASRYERDDRAVDILEGRGGDVDDDTIPWRREHIDDERPIDGDADLFAASMQLCDVIYRSGPMRGRERPHLVSRRTGNFAHTLGPRRALFEQLEAWRRDNPHHSRARLATQHGLSGCELAALDLLMHSRMIRGSSGAGMGPEELAHRVGLTRPGEMRRMCDLLGSDGPLVRNGLIEVVDTDVRPMQRRVSITRRGCETLFGDGVDYSQYEGDPLTSRADGPRRFGRRPPWEDDGDEDGSGAWTLHTSLDERPLVLPPDETRRLDHAVRSVPLRAKVADELGFRALIGYGLGTAMLFQGLPGTGKTLAAHVVARRLGRPLLEVSTAQLLSKWVGDTEKSIQRVFDLAAKKRAVLLLDEADSLLRSREGAVRSWEVTQVNVLLRCIERHEGVVILTTNFVSSLDSALERRLTLNMEFPVPQAPERAQIWRALIGDRLELDGDVDLDLLAAQWALTGSQIKTAVLDIALRAVARDERRVELQDFEAAVTEVLGDRRSTAPVGF